MLTATGAWYTDSKSHSGAQESKTFTMGSFAELEIDGSDNLDIKAYNVIEGTKTEVEASDYVYPNSTIEVVEGTKLSIKVKSDKDFDFWYVYSKDGGTTWTGATATTALKHIKDDETYGGLELASVNLGTAEITGTLGASEVTRGSGTNANVFTINPKLTQTEAASDTVIVTIAAAQVEVRIVQYANLTAGEAWTKLTSNYDNINA